ncbi:MAG: twin-arginine translocation signal domain-containing protein [Pseudomonadota bacterium]
MDKDRQTSDRRGFLKLAGASVAGAGVAVAASGAAQAADTVAAAEERGDYRTTDHVKRYYDLARDY